MTNLWILVADAGGARIFSKLPHTPGISLVQQLDNPDGRARTHHLVSDHRGQADKGGTGVMSAMQPPTDPHEEKAIEFARKLDHLLENAAAGGKFDRLSLVAPPHFLGLLRAHLGTECKHRLDKCAAKDFKNIASHDMAQRLKETFDQVDAVAI